MATVATLNVLLKANTAQLAKNMKGANGIIDGFAKSTIASFLGASGIVYAFKRAAEEIDTLSKTARRLGIATEAMGGLEVGAKRSGIAIEQVTMALQRMTRRISEAKLGTGEAVKAIAEMGLNAESLAMMRPEQQLGRIADALKALPSQADRVRLAFKLFDSEGVKMIQMLENGSEGLRQFQEEAKRLGLVMTADGARSVERFNDAMGRMQDSARGKWRQAVISLADGYKSVTLAIYGVQEAAIRMNLAISKRLFSEEATREAKRRLKEIIRLQNELHGIQGKAGNLTQGKVLTAAERGFGGFNQIPGMGWLHARQGAVAANLANDIKAFPGQVVQGFRSMFDKGPNPFTEGLWTFLRENQARTAGTLLRDIGGVFGGGTQNLFSQIAQAFAKTARPDMPILGAVERGSVEAAYQIAQAKRDSRNQKVLFDQLGEQKQIKSILNAINLGIKDALVQAAPL